MKKKLFPKPFACLECGHRMSAMAAEKAASSGCSKCGGVDVDLFVKATTVDETAHYRSVA